MVDMEANSRLAAKIRRLIVAVASKNVDTSELISTICDQMAQGISEYTHSDIIWFAELISLRSKISDHLEYGSTFLGNGMSMSMAIETIRSIGDRSSKLASMYMSMVDDAKNSKDIISSIP